MFLVLFLVLLLECAEPRKWELGQKACKYQAPQANKKLAQRFGR